MQTIIDAIIAYSATKIVISPELVEGLTLALATAGMTCTVVSGTPNHAQYYTGTDPEWILSGMQIQVSNAGN